MNASTAQRPANPREEFLAGLQAGMMGVCWMLAWLGVSGIAQRRGFWSAENLLASVFYGEGAIRPGFSSRTVSGAALYLTVYSLLGAGFAVAVRQRLTALGTVLLGILVAAGWYGLCFRMLGRTMMPLVWLLHTESSTVFGHVIFGVWMARYRAFLAPSGEAGGACAGPAVETAEEAATPDSGAG